MYLQLQARKIHSTNNRHSQNTTKSSYTDSHPSIETILVEFKEIGRQNSDDWESMVHLFIYNKI